MAEEETNSRIAELKARLEADPGSRVFYQLGEELRKSGQTEEAEATLREGLQKHSSYLSAWISLGRVLKESRPHEAIDVLNRAFELDRQNVVVARLLGEAYSDTGDHVEAIKKYKLVAALHPADEEIQERITGIENILRGEGKLEERHGEASGHTASPPVVAGAGSEPAEELQEAENPSSASTSAVEPDVSSEQHPFDTADDDGWPSPPSDDAAKDGNLSDGLDDRVAEDEAVEDEEDWGGPETTDAADPETDDQSSSDDVVSTITMGDLYARQGHVDQARAIYRSILEREPEHGEARERLDSLPQDEHGPEESDSTPPSSSERVSRLEEWLSRVRR